MENSIWCTAKNNPHFFSFLFFNFLSFFLSFFSFFLSIYLSFFSLSFFYLCEQVSCTASCCRWVKSMCSRLASTSTLQTSSGEPAYTLLPLEGQRATPCTATAHWVLRFVFSDLIYPFFSPLAETLNVWTCCWAVVLTWIRRTSLGGKPLIIFYIKEHVSLKCVCVCV